MKTLTERTDSALAWIDEQLAICNAATAGPWAVESARGVIAVGLGWIPICYPFGNVETRSNDATFIAAARTGYPAVLLSLQDALLALSEIQENGFCHCEKAFEFILSKIEALYERT